MLRWYSILDLYGIQIVHGRSVVLKNVRYVALFLLWFVYPAIASIYTLSPCYTDYMGVIYDQIFANFVWFSTSDFKLEKQYNLKIEYIARPKSESHRCFVCCNFTQKLCESVHRLRLYIPALVHKTKTLKHHHFF